MGFILPTVDISVDFIDLLSHFIHLAIQFPDHRRGTTSKPMMQKLGQKWGLFHSVTTFSAFSRNAT